MNIEPLESRIVPALVVAANHLSATFTDVGGDLVTIIASKPILDDDVLPALLLARPPCGDERSRL